MAKEPTFWDHLEVLRGSLLRILAAALVAAIAAFVCKDWLFQLVLAPKEPDFITYRFFARLGLALPEFDGRLINIELVQQLLIHMKVALCAGLLIVSPYILYELFRFVSPALYAAERSYALKAVSAGYFMFLAGVALNYLLIFPLTYRFLGTYQVSAEVPNVTSLGTYVSTLLMLCFMMGLVFELPVLCWLLAKMGLMQSQWMKRYRRHAIVVILIVAAVITPTADAFTLSLVALPIYLLYEASIFVVGRVEKKKMKSESNNNPQTQTQ